jgi:hypothetical protein
LKGIYSLMWMWLARQCHTCYRGGSSVLLLLLLWWLSTADMIDGAS